MSNKNAKKTKHFNSKSDEFDWKVFDNYLKFKPSLKMSAELMGVGESSIRRYIKEKFDMSYTEYADIKLTDTKMKLIQKAVNAALSGNNNTMLIFCLKNICKWQDSPEPEATQLEDLEFV